MGPFKAPDVAQPKHSAAINVMFIRSHKYTLRKCHMLCFHSNDAPLYPFTMIYNDQPMAINLLDRNVLSKNFKQVQELFSLVM